MGAALSITMTLETHTCGKCGIEFAAPLSFWADRQKDHSLDFYCPNGHRRAFIGETEAQKLARQLAEEKKTSDLFRGKAIAAEFTARALTDKMKRLRKRASAGVCPCCKRTFKQLAAHMGQKHRGYEKQDIG